MPATGAGWRAMKKFKLLEHTADTGLEACGSNLAEAFANAAFGMFSIIADPADIKEVASRLVEVDEADAEALLFEWLNRLVLLFDVESMLFSRFEMLEFNETHLKAKCWGEKYDPVRHGLKMGIKSATYHQLTVDRQRNCVRVIFDI